MQACQMLLLLQTDCTVLKLYHVTTIVVVPFGCTRFLSQRSKWAILLDHVEFYSPHSLYGMSYNGEVSHDYFDTWYLCVVPDCFVRGLKTNLSWCPIPDF